MVDELQSRRDVIEALGGRDFVTTELKVGTSAISNWIKDGFPKGRMPDLLVLAQRVGAAHVTLTLLLSLEAKYPARPAPESAQAA